MYFQLNSFKMRLFPNKISNKLNFHYYCWRRMIGNESHKVVYKGKLSRNMFAELGEKYLSERRVNDVNEDMFKELMVDKQSTDRVKDVISKYEEMKENQSLYPSDITLEDMKKMMSYSYNYLTDKYLRYLFIREFDIWRTKYKTMNKKLEIQRHRENWEKGLFKTGVFDGNDCLQYGFWRNTLFSRIYSSAVTRYSLNNLRMASLFGQTLVIDCSFDQSMADYEVGSAYRQMARIYSMNRYSSLPYDLHFCNCDPDSRVVKHFKKAMNCFDDPKYFVNIHEESYLELFPNKRFVYLSPHSKKVMTEYDDNAIYIIASLVDKTCSLPFTTFKAGIEGVDHCKLPLSLFVPLKRHVNLVLGFDRVFKVMLDLKQHRDWRRALIDNIEGYKIIDNVSEKSCDTEEDNR